MPRSNSDFRARACKSTACIVKLRVQSNNCNFPHESDAGQAWSQQDAWHDSLTLTLLLWNALVRSECLMRLTTALALWSDAKSLGSWTTDCATIPIPPRSLHMGEGPRPHIGQQDRSRLRKSRGATATYSLNAKPYTVWTCNVNYNPFPFP
jgi:hypothetical protein